MCTRYVLLEQHYRDLLAQLGIGEPAAFISRYNIAPGSAIPVIRRTAQPPKGEAATLRWGLVPSWSQGPDAGPMLVNARAETVAAKPSFRAALRSRRCVIPASGYYEWQTVGRAKKPWLFRRSDGRPFGFAGLWEHWRGPDGTELESCAFVTTTPNDLTRPIHDRMPVLLAPADFGSWLDPAVTEPAQLAPLLRSADPATMSALAVSTYVSSVRHEGPACLAPASADPPPDSGPQLSLGI